MDDLYKSKRRIETALLKIKNSNLSKKNKELIIKFHNDCFSEGLSSLRILKYVYTLYGLASRLEKNFDDVNTDDIKILVGKIERSDYAEWTKHDYKVVLRRFYKWLRESDEYPPEVKWIKATMKNNRTKLPEELLTEGDVKKLIIAANNPRDKAIVSVLYESGVRLGELLSLKLKNVQFDKYGAILSVNGKTGYRRVRVVSSTPYLTDWINNHPDKDNPESPLWITNDYRKKQIGYGRIRALLLSIKKRTNVKKKVNAHNFRHSRATFLANHLTEAQLKEMFGWVRNSDMASIYVHLSGRDVDNALLKTYDIETDREKKKETVLKPKICIRCEEVNPPTNKFCSKCGLALDKETIVEIMKNDVERKEADKILDELIQDQNFRNLFLSKIKKLSNKTFQTT